MKFLLLVIDLVCIHIYLDLIYLPLKYLNFLRLLFLMQTWAFIQQFRHMLEVQYIFVQRNFGKGFLSERCVYIDFAHGLSSIDALDMPKNVPRRRKWSLGHAHFYLGEIKRFRLERCWMGKSLDFYL